MWGVIRRLGMLVLLPARNSRRKALWLPCALALWGVAIAVGLCAEWRFSRTAGAAGNVARQWPAESRIVRESGPTLLLFVHPRCPCSTASLAELAALLAEASGKIKAHVVFWQPSGAGQDWRETQLVRQARELPGVQIEWDEAGAEALRFGALTSGFTVCFDAQGALQFAGGITLARGHTGDNAGRAAIRTWLEQGRARLQPVCVYGCPLATTLARK